MSNTDDNARHQKKMQHRKEVMDKKIAAAQDERGVLLVNTGNGKGKSSSAFGMVARALGHSMRVGVVQFVKGAQSTGEEAFFRRFPEVDYHVMGEGFTWETQDKARDIEKAEAAWAQAKKFLCDETINLVVLDELNIVLRLKYLDLDTVLADLKQRPAMQHVVATGRGALPGLIEIADTVSEINEVKHAFKAGVRAQKGVEM
ncbi:MAG: cob(I)yrinic acid a,c-diamide adenosyltransferase [Pseudomonadales bacterium]